MEETQHDSLHLQLVELEKTLITTKWNVLLERDWVPIERSSGRHETRIIQEDLDKLNQKLSKLQPIALMEYFKMFNKITIKHSLISHSLKGKLILYQLLQGCPNHELPIVSGPTYRRIYEKVWIKHSQYIIRWIDEWMERFSSPQLRVIYSHLFNPNPFKAVTLFVDGKDFVTALTELGNEKRKTKAGKSTLTSAKNKFKNGGKVLFLDDSRMMPISVSKMVGANEMYDGHLMETLNLLTMMHPEFDNLIYDHHFDHACDELIKTAKLKKINLNESNFTPAIRKQPGQSLSDDELQFNSLHGSFRSKQETCRNAALVNTFKRFSSGCKMRCRNFDVLLLQLKLCLVLLSISNQQRNYPNLFELQFDVASFEYPTENTVIKSLKVNTLISLGEEMRKRQLTALAGGLNGIESQSSSSDSENSLDEVSSTNAFSEMGAVNDFFFGSGDIVDPSSPEKSAGRILSTMGNREKRRQKFIKAANSPTKRKRKISRAESLKKRKLSFIT